MINAYQSILVSMYQCCAKRSCNIETYTFSRHIITRIDLGGLVGIVTGFLQECPLFSWTIHFSPW